MVQIRKRLRVGGIVAVAVLIGATAVISAPALLKLTGGQPDSAAGVIIKTRTASCAGVAFFPGSSGTDHATGPLGLRIRTSTNGGAEFWCDPGLPNKATVTKVVFDVQDSNATGQVNSCRLFAIPLTASGASLVEMANVPATGAAQMPGRVLLTDTTIVGNPTSNGTTGYALLCYLETGGGPVDDDLGLYGASITYTITAGNG